MKIPFLTEVNVDMIIRALGYAGILPNEVDRNTIRTLNGDLDETGRDKIAGLFTYGGGGGGGGLVSTTDIYALIDSDATPGAHSNDFILGRYVDVGPLTNWKNRLFSVGFDSTTETASLGYITSVLGPTTALLGTSAPTPTYVSAYLDLGGSKGNSRRSAYCRLLGASDGAKYDEGGTLQTKSGTSLRSYGSLELTCGHGAFITFRATDEQHRSGGDAAAAITIDRNLGGFTYSSVTNLRSFCVGPSFDTGNDSLLIQQVVNPWITNKTGFELRMAQTANDSALDYRTLNLTTDNPEHVCYYVVNGEVSGSTAQPFTRSPDVDMAIFSVFGADGQWSAGQTLALFKSVAPNTTATGYDIVLIKGADDSISSNAFFLLRAQQWDGVSAWDTRFSINNIGNVRAAGTITPGGADVAELLEPAELVEVGDVLVVNASGEYVRSTVDADHCVVGVVAEKPGITLNHGGDPATKTPLTVCGITPVRCTTAIGGAIVPGDLLVATTGGQARKSSVPALPGTIIGKALQSLAKDGDTDTTGQISVLVNLQ